MKNNFGSKVFDCFVKQFSDDEHGGIYSAIGFDRHDVITEDKMVVNAALALITAIKFNNAKLAKKYYQELDLFRGKNNYSEIIEASSVPVDVGYVKTFSTQVVLLFSKVLYANFINNLTLKNSSLTSFNKLLTLENELNFPNILTLDNDVIDSEQSAVSIALAAYVSKKMNLLDWYRLLTAKIQSFKDNADGYWSYLDSANRPVVTEGKSLLAQATIMLIEEHSSIEKHIQFINKHYLHPYTGGFWSKVNKENQVSVENISSYYGKNESPFPIKSMLDHAMLTFALRNNNSDLAQKMFDTSVKQLGRFWNTKSGGISLGQGNWFSTPTTPTVPLARQVMVPQHTVGSFAIGNTFYLPLHEKTASIQLLSAIALYDVPMPMKPVLRKIDYTSKRFEVNHDYIAKGNLDSSYIDINKYLVWSNKTKSGFGNGLTPYKSPLGFKSDKTPQNFSAMHVISDFSVLAKTISNKNEIFLNMKASQNEDGGFSEQPSLPSELFTTYCVVLSAYILGTTDYDIAKCIEFVKDCQNEDGGFGNAPGYPSDAWHCNFGTLILHILDSKPREPEQLIQYLLNCQNEDGGFSVLPNSKSETFSTFRAIDSLIVSGVQIPNVQRTVTWLQSLQDKNGGFYFAQKSPVSFVGTYHTIAALYLLGALPLDVEATKKWFYHHQAKDGGFSKIPDSPSDTTDEGFIAIHASYMLEHKLNPYWTAIIT